jgi:hypothetical protein
LRLIAQEIHLLLALEFPELFLPARGVLLALQAIDIELPLYSFELLLCP